MFKYRYIKAELGRVCRACLNQNHRLSLTPRDCLYDDYPHICAGCGEVKNIVSDVKLSKRFLI